MTEQALASRDGHEDPTLDIESVLHGVREWGRMRDPLLITKAESRTIYTYLEHVGSLAQEQGRVFEHEETVRYIKRLRESERQRATLQSELDDARREVEVLRKEQAARRSKKLNTVKWEVRVRLSDAERFAEVLKAEYGTAAGGAFRVTAGEFLEDNVFRCYITYGPTRGVHPSDVRKKFARVARLSGTEVLGEPEVTTLERIDEV